MAKANLGELLIKIGIDTKKLDAGLGNANKSLKKFGLSSNKVAIGVSAAFAGMALAVGAFGRAVNDVGSQFEQSMATVGAVAGSTEGQLGLMETRAREVGRSTLFTARQSADAMVEFARAGFKAGEIIAATEPAINLAGATASNMTSAVKGVSAALKVFQLDASQAARVADVFAVATQNSLFDLQGLIDAMKYGGPASAAFDLTIEQATAYMMVLRNMGLEASQAGVYLRQILTSAANLTPKAAKIFESVGISAEELNPRINHLDDIIKRLGDNAQLTAEDIQNAFGKRGGPVVAALVNQYRRLGEEGLNFLEFQKQLEQSAGKAEEMYRRQIDTVIGQFTIARSAMEDLFIEMFFGFNGQLKNLGTAFEGLFNEIRIAVSGSGFVGFSDPIQKFADIINSEKANIAQAFVSIANSVAILLKGLVELLSIIDGPLLSVIKNLDLILKAFSFGVVTYLIVTALPSLIGLVSALSAAVASGTAVFLAGTVAVQGFAAVIAALGGPITVAIALITVLGISIAALMRSTEGVSDAERNRLALQEELEEKTRKQAEATSSLTDSLKSQASESGILSGNLSIYIDQLDALNEKQIQVGLSSGTLFETSGGAVMSLALAFEMQKQGMEGAASLIEDAKRNAVDLRKEAELENQLLTEKNNKLVELNKRRLEGKKFNDIFDEASKILGQQVETMDQVNHVLGQSKKRVAQLSGAYATLEKGILRGELLEHQEAINAAIQVQTRSTEDQIKATKDLKNAILSRYQLEISLFQQIENLQTQGQSARENEVINAQTRAHEIFEAEIAAMKAAGRTPAAIAKVEEAKQAHLKNIELKSRLETINKLEELEKSSIERTASMREMSQAEELNLEYLREKEQFDRIYAEELRASGFSLELEKRYEDSILALKKETIAKAEEIRRADENKRLADIDRITTEIGTRDLKESERLALEKNRILSKLKADEVGKRLVIESDYNFRIRQAEKNERRNIIQFINWRIKRGQEGVKRMLNKGKGKVAPFIALMFGMDEESRINRFIKRQSIKLDKQLNRQFKINKRRIGEGKPEKEFGRFKEKFERLKESAKKAAQGIGQVIGATLGAAAAGVTKAVAVMKSISGAVSSVIGKLSGFSFSPTEMARELVSAQEKALEEGAGFSYAKEARKYVDGLVSQAVAFTTAIANGIGPALEALVDGLPDILQGIVDALPKIATALADSLPDLIMVVIDNLPALFTALVDGLVKVALALFEALPEMLTQLLSVALPEMITSLLGAIPKLIKGLVDALPGIFTAIIESIPVIIEAILASLPDIIVAIIQAIPVILLEIIKAIPRISIALVVGIFKGLSAMIGRFSQIIAEAFASVFAFFKDFIGGLKDTLKSDPEKNAGQKALTTLVDILTFGGAQRFEKAGGQWAGNKGTSANPDGGSAYSGISYVPANMRVNVHKGEAIVPANRNAQMNRGGMDRAAPASYGGNMNGSGGQPIDIAIMAEGRLLDAVQITAMRRGHAPEIKNELRRASGVTVGFNRGSFDYWTK